jgi:chemotaxis protein MotA
MGVIIGGIVVIGAVLTGFSMAGGSIGALIHPSELVTIGGASFGALIVMSPKKVLVDLFRAVLQLIKGSPYNKQTYIELFKLLYALTRVLRREGALTLDSHLSNPAGSNIFQQAPRITKNPHVNHFLCGALSLIVDGKTDGEQLTNWLNEEISVVEREHHAAVGVLTKTADSLPGFGIVAAVLGIVVTMQSINGPVEEIGHKVGAALVGTFLGILLCYGFFAPMAGRMELMGEQEKNFFQTIVAAVVAINEGVSPKDVITRACRGVGTEFKPTQADLRAIFNERESS